MKDSRLDLLLHGLKSNPQSFSLRHSSQDQRDETELLCGKLDDLLEEDRSGSDEGLREVYKTQTDINCKFMDGEESNINYGVKDHGNGEADKKASFVISGDDTDDEDDALSTVSTVSTE